MPHGRSALIFTLLQTEETSDVPRSLVRLVRLSHAGAIVCGPGFRGDFLLPGLQVCLGPVLGLLLLAWWVDGRWSLPAWGANALGVLIAARVAVWLALHLSDSESWLSRVPMQLAVLPYTGPLLMAALLVRVFRPRRPAISGVCKGWD